MRTGRRFVGYVEKIFGLWALLAEHVREGRRRPQIGLGDILRCVLWLYGCRLRSLNALENVLRRKGRGLVERRVPSADTIGRVMAQTDPEGLREVLVGVCARARRAKALGHRGPLKLWCAGLDGHELFKSFRRHCAECLTREVRYRDETRVQYYHMEVRAQLVDAEPPMSLDTELVRPGESEIVAARRLVRRVIANFPFVEAFSLDALYLEAPILKQIVQAGKGAIVVLKQERRELYEETMRLCALQAAQEGMAGGDRVEFWDFSAVKGWEALEGIPVRVVRTRHHRALANPEGPRGSKRLQIQDWMWAVVGLGEEVSPLAIHRLGHARWDVENCGFNEQDRFFGLDHCYKHAPHAIVNFILVLLLAALLTEVFFTRNLKRPEARTMSLAALAQWLLEELPGPNDPPLWPPARGP